MKRDLVELPDVRAESISTFVTELKKLPGGDSHSHGKIKVLLGEKPALPMGYLSEQPGEWLKYMLKIQAEARQEGEGMVFGSRSAALLAEQLPLFFTTAFRHLDTQLADYQNLRKRKVQWEHEVNGLGEKKAKAEEEVQKLQEEKATLLLRLEMAEQAAVKAKELEAERNRLAQENAGISAKFSMSQDLGKEINRLVQAVSVAGSAYSLYNYNGGASNGMDKGNEKKQDPVKDSEKMLRFWSPARLLSLLVIGHISGYVPVDRLQKICQGLQSNQEAVVKTFLPLLESYLKSPVVLAEHKTSESIQSKAIPLIQRLYSDPKLETVMEVWQQLEMWGVETSSTGISVFADFSAAVWRGASEHLKEVVKKTALTKEPVVAEKDTPSMITRIYHMLNNGGSLLPKAEMGRGAFYSDVIKFRQLLATPLQTTATVVR